LAADKERNPASVHQFEGNWQAFSVYRQQWRSIGVPFNTASFFFTKKFYTSDPALSFFGSFNYTNDQSGDGKLSINLLSLNTGASYRLGKNIFSIAVNNSYTLKSFNEGQLTFPGQYDRTIGGFNKQFSNGESFEGGNTSFFNLGLGSSWERRISNRFNLISGFSVSNLIEPSESFYELDNRKNRGYGLQFVGTYSLSEHYDLEPYLSFYRAGGASETVVGSAIILNGSSLGPVENIKPFVYLRTGPDRNSDALILGSYADWGNFQLGASYDFNLSDLEIASNYRGGFELTLAYTGKERKLDTKRIPCVRY